MLSAAPPPPPPDSGSCAFWCRCPAPCASLHTAQKKTHNHARKPPRHLPALPARRRRRTATALPTRAEVQTEGTASGLEIGGMRPTSPKAWAVVSTRLKEVGA